MTASRQKDQDAIGWQISNTNFIFSYMPQSLLILIYRRVDIISLYSKFQQIHPLHLMEIMIAYGVYPPTCLIAKNALFYLFMCNFTISSFITVYLYPRYVLSVKAVMVYWTPCWISLMGSGMVPPCSYISSSWLGAWWWAWGEREQADTHCSSQHDIHTYLWEVGWCALAVDHVKYLPCKPAASDNVFGM